MTIYQKLESGVRSYCRHFPLELDTAKASKVTTVDGTCYIDFLMGCGSLNFGHNPPPLQSALSEYIQADGVAMTMDFHSSAKSQFLTDFNNIILRPRKLEYKLHFTGPTGTNAVEAACKIFMNGLSENVHGMGDAGSLSLASLRAMAIINQVASNTLGTSATHELVEIE
ncbi:aminotransferase class III-fold pyridoxal phosphate-dependent enzyme [Vibrio sp. SCSIO 43136]|uniref:aminotransferase class III-fold pyridoxal phosphate-dependent enzyme n=1 Tax=Vibrio sp. SCSIO 43136 TaxID=2819101 RepID=UPI002075B0DE|nr:aminotransferase class III-fold pyridoxal phosphate-dependent enzyme [Vibrio sp. SCSIO 43136]USD66107.1 aminotransferase class III-fold pyridoxal phosphate-dependent enzyme [Vibrio sp. SCSIO 43136]